MATQRASDYRCVKLNAGLPHPTRHPMSYLHLSLSSLLATFGTLPAVWQVLIDDSLVADVGILFLEAVWVYDLPADSAFHQDFVRAQNVLGALFTYAAERAAGKLRLGGRRKISILAISFDRI